MLSVSTDSIIEYRWRISALIVTLNLLLFLNPTFASAQSTTFNTLQECYNALPVTWGNMWENFAMEFDIESHTKNLPNPNLIGYRWKIEEKAHMVGGGQINYDESLQQTGHFEITESYDPFTCLPALKGTTNGMVKWQTSQMYPDCRMVGPDDGSVPFSAKISGYAANQSMQLEIQQDNRSVYRFYDQCRWDDEPKESTKDLSIIISHISTNDFEYRDYNRESLTNPNYYSLDRYQVDFQETISLTSECPLAMTTPTSLVINVVPQLTPPTYDKTLSGMQITLQKTGDGTIDGQPPSVDKFHGGLTLPSEDISVFLNSDDPPARFGNRRCFQVDSIDVVLSYSKLPVYIANDYPVGSCNDRAIRAHENEHVRQAYDVLQSHADIMKNALVNHSFPTKELPLPCDSDSALIIRYKAEIKTLLAPIFLKIDAANTEAFKSWDTEERMAEVMAKCPHW